MLSHFRKVVLGEHPHNTIFSYNWHNVRHLHRFLRNQAAAMAGPLAIADIGGGNSPYFEYFSTSARSFVSVDVDRPARSVDNRPITFVAGMAESIPLEDASVDLVLCNQVLEHVTDPVAAVAEIWRILTPGGVVLGSVPHISPVHLEPYDFRRFTDLGVAQLFGNQGFQEIQVEGNGGAFSAAALCIWMDLLLTNRKDGNSQGFRANLALLVSPLVGISNAMALVLDTLFSRGNRSPANLCWSARKPATV